jgi:4'-phosphopantetheinyl transferase
MVHVHILTHLFRGGDKTFPMNIHWLEQTEADIPAENQWLNANEILRLNALRIPKRRADWRLGRWTAKHAVAACLNLPTEPSSLADIEIRAASSGAPEVFLHDEPAEIAISLSHSSGTALCTLAPPGVTFGCDLETVEPRSDAFVADYFTVDERNLIARSSKQERPLLLALLWSAKESALKALRVGLRFDTRCMSVSPVDDWHSTDNPDAWRSLSVCYSGGMVFHGCWRIQDHLVRTVVSELSLPIHVHAQSAHLSIA